MIKKVRVVNGDGRVKYVMPAVAKDAKAMKAQGFRIEALPETQKQPEPIVSNNEPQKSGRKAKLTEE